jgi:polysaccharide biosynthesis transport protein
MNHPHIPSDRIAAAESNELLDLRAIGRAVRRRKWPILIVSAAVILLTIVVYFLTDPRYIATASMVVERQPEEVVPAETDTPVLATDSPTVDTAVQILQSPFIAGRVVDSLKLVDQPEFNPELLKANTPARQTATQRNAARERAIRILGGSLGVTREGISYAIGVQYASPNPEMAAAIPNEVINQYLANNIESEARTTRRSVALLEARLEELRGEVLTAEAEVARYRASEGLFAASNASSITQQELSVLNTQLAEAKALEAAANARLSTARSQASRGMSGETLGEALNSEVIAGLRNQRAQLSAQVADAGSRYGPLHPNSIKTREQLNDIDQQINAEVRRVVASLASEARVAQGRSGSIASSLGGLEGRLATDTTASVRLSELERNAQSARELYQSLLDEYKKAVARQGTENSGAKAISRASVPVLPASPKPLLFAAIALVGAAVASAFVLMAMEFFERGLRTSDAVEKKLHVRSVGLIPELETLTEAKGSPSWPPDFLLEHPHSKFAETFRVLRTSLLFGSGNRGMKIVCVTSALPDEGKSSAAISLARSSAQAGIATIVVDCDSRSRDASVSFPARSDLGLDDVLQGKCSPEQAIFYEEKSGVSYLVQKAGDRVSPDLMASAQMDALLARLRQQFALIILDTAPVLPVAEARGIAALADGVLLLVRWKKTPVKAAEIALRELEAIGAHVVGVALSRVDVAKQARTGFDDADDYAERYQQYYA